MRTVYGDYANKVFDVILGNKEYCAELLLLQTKTPTGCKKEYFTHYAQVWNKFLSIEWDGLVD